MVTHLIFCAYRDKFDRAGWKKKAPAGLVVVRQCVDSDEVEPVESLDLNLTEMRN